MGTLALVALLVVVYRRTDWSKGFTPDGALTLVAAAIAFIAVIVQIRSSSEQVQDQIKAQRDAEEAERERQRRAVAAALLAEVDSFYARFLQRRSKLFDSWKRTENDPQSREVFHSVAGNPFVVYESLADKLGDFDATVTRAIVLTYGAMSAFTETAKRYEREASGTRSGDPAAQEIRRLTREYMRNKMRDTAEVAVQSVVIACRVLCGLSNTDYSALFVSKEPGAGPQDLASKVPRSAAGVDSGNA